MSSRSIGVTNVWLRRWMMSWVIRSPSCSQIRISLASSLRSGYSFSSSSKRPAARLMFPPASSNRSKNSRSRGARTFARRTGGTLALVHVERGEFDPGGGRLADTLSRRRHGSAPVVFDAPVLDSIAVDDGVGGAVVAVERHPDAAGIHELDPARTGALEGEVRVPEDDALDVHAHKPLRVGVVRLRIEAVHVGER